MRRVITLITSFFVLAAWLLQSHQPGHAAPTNERYRIAAILPLSGPSASLGRYVKNGLDLAYSRLPEDRKAKIELIYEDDQLQSAKAVSAFQRLRTQQGIDAAFVLGSGIGNAVAPLAERSRTLLVAIGASDGGIAKGRKYAFVHWVTPEVEAAAMIDEIERRGYKRLAVVSTQHEGAYAVLSAVKN